LLFGLRPNNKKNPMLQFPKKITRNLRKFSYPFSLKTKQLKLDQHLVFSNFPKLTSKFLRNRVSLLDLLPKVKKLSKEEKEERQKTLLELEEKLKEEKHEEKDLINKYKKDLLKLEKKQRKYTTTVLEEQKALEKEKLYQDFTPEFVKKLGVSKKHPLLADKETRRRVKSLNVYLKTKYDKFGPILSFSKYPNLIQHSKFNFQHFKHLRKAKSSTLTRWRFKKILNKKKVGKVFRIFFLFK